MTIQKISVDKKNKIIEDLTNKNLWYEHALTDLDSWIAFYYMFGRFPGAEKFTNAPNVNKPIFLQTEMLLSPLEIPLSPSRKRTRFTSWFRCFKYLFWWK